MDEKPYDSDMVPTEAEGVTHGEEHERHEARERHARGKDGDDVFLANHAAIEHGQARNVHAEHQRGARHHPRLIG